MDESLVILEAKNMYHIYESLSLEGNVVALRGLNVRINEGEAVAVIGPSGSGKSTLLTVSYTHLTLPTKRIV